MKADALLQQDVGEELKREPSVQSTQIGVAVKYGVVTLSGEVSSYAEKWNAECAAQRVASVKALAVNLTVRTSGLGKRTDAQIARSAENVIEWSTYLPKDCIRNLVAQGHVTLTGEVTWPYQKQAAVDAVRFPLGVTDAGDQIALKPTVSIGAVKDQFEAAQRRGAYAEADAITVGVHGNEVTLSGTVRSWSERELATPSAWGSPGVRNVIDKLALVS